MTSQHKIFTRSASACLLLFGLAFSPAVTQAAEKKIFFGEGGFGVDDTTLIIDQRDATGNLTLQFGNSLGESILWNQTNAQFEVSNNLSLGGSQLVDFRVENASSAPTCDGTRNGRMYHHTIEDISYICDGASWNRVDSIWSVNGSDAYYSTGKVGIGINPPISTAHVHENTTTTDSTAGLTIENEGTGDAVAQFLTTGVTRWVAGIDNSDSDIFKIASSADLDSNAVLSMTTDGNVGIGAPSPNFTLDVAGSVGLQEISAATADVAGTGQIWVKDDTPNTLWFTDDDGADVQLGKESTSTTLMWYLDGNQFVDTSQGPTVTLPFDMTVTGIDIKAGTAPTGSSLIIDINEGGTTIFATRAEIDASSTVEDDNEVFSDTSLASGAEIILDVDQVGSTFEGSDLTVELHGTRNL